MTIKGAKGAMIAAAVAGLFTTAAPLIASAKDAGKVHCAGVNACKGKGGCKGADNSCKGQNGCKGKGWMDMSEKKCTDKGGTVMPAGDAPKK
jgi:hypothetical protein